MIGLRRRRLSISRSMPWARSICWRRRASIAPEACFIFTSTNKVYGDTPNRLPLVEQATRWELPDDHPYGRHGIDESMSIDQTMHSLFGASKVAADVLVQEYGRYFGHEDRLLPRRVPDRPRPFGHSAARLSRLSREMRGHRHPLYRLRLQRQAGAGQHPLLRSGKRVLAFLRGAALRRGLQHRRRALLQLLDDRGDRRNARS